MAVQQRQAPLAATSAVQVGNESSDDLVASAGFNPVDTR
jgi:hypothetical protein